MAERKRKLSKLLAGCALVGWTGSMSHAVTRRADVDPGDTVYKAAANAFPAVGKVTESGGWASGTLIAPNWVLTAGHVIFGAGQTPVNFIIGGNTYSIAQTIAHPGWTGNIINGNDIALIRLSSNVTNVTPIGWYSGHNEIGLNVDVVGFGGTGTGLTGANTFDQLKRAGTNTIDATAVFYTTVKDGNGNFYTNPFNPASAINDFLLMDFDDPNNADGLNAMGSTVPTAREMSVAGGDSGGAALADFGFGPVVTGVTSYLDYLLPSDTPKGDGTGNASYSDLSGFSRASSFSSWIASNIFTPVSSTWNVNASGTWTPNSNWTGNSPNQLVDTATFGPAILSPRTVTVDSQKIVSTINFNNTNKYTLAGTSAIILDSTTTAAINVTNGSHDITAPLALYQDTNITVTNAENTLNITNLQPTIQSMTKLGAGTLQLNRISAKALTVSAGKTVLASPTIPGPTSIASDLTTLSINTSAGAKLDLASGASLVVRTTGAKSAMVAYVLSGQNGYDNNGFQNWNGPGIVSSAARANNIINGADVFGVGVIRNGDLNTLYGSGSAYTSWYNQSVGVEDILIKYTYMGDSNLDGTINIDDYNAIDGTFLSLTPNLGWISGDFNYDGTISIDDYNAIDFSYLIQGGQLSQEMISQRFTTFGAEYVASLESFAASVPEPSILGLSFLLLPLIGKRRYNPRRSQSQETSLFA